MSGESLDAATPSPTSRGEAGASPDSESRGKKRDMENRPSPLRSRRVCRFCLTEAEPLSFIYERDHNKPFQVPLTLQIMSCVAIEVSGPPPPPPPPLPPPAQPSPRDGLASRETPPPPLPIIGSFVGSGRLEGDEDV